MQLPTREACFHMLREHSITPGILAHTKQVTRIANYIAQKFSDAGIPINLELVDRGALLHDIAKYISIENDVAHGEAGAEIVREYGYPEVADIVKDHVLERIIGGHLKSWEDKIVFYADKRVNHAEVVSLEERFEYLLQRYGAKNPALKEKILASKPYVFKLEKEIFSRIDVGPELRELK